MSEVGRSGVAGNAIPRSRAAAAGVKRILIVDDCPEDRVFYRRLLENGDEGAYHFAEAESARDALALRGGQTFDCVLLDFGLPDLDGIELLAELADAEGYCPVAVIMLTGQGDRSVAERALTCGAQDFLVKGRIDAELLKRSILYAIERKSDEHELRGLNCRLETELRERLAQLEAANVEVFRRERIGALGVIGAGVAHELNNPLTGILNQIQYALTKIPAEGRVFDVLSGALEDTRRCARIVQDLLSYARSDQDDCATDLNSVIRGVLAASEEEVRSNGIRLSATFDNAVSPVALGDGHIHQVARNLISNACHALESVTCRDLVVETRDRGDAAELWVHDSGPGLDEHTRSRMFEPFFTTKPAGRGTGLGLYLCKNLVEHAGGRIEVESVPGRGTTIAVVLPKSSRSGRRGGFDAE